MSEARKYFILSILVTAVFSAPSWLPVFRIDPDWFHFWLVEVFQRFLPIIAIIVGLCLGWLAHERAVNPRKTWLQRRREAAEAEQERIARIERENAERVRRFRVEDPNVKKLVAIMRHDGSFDMTEALFGSLGLVVWAEYETLDKNLGTNEVEVRAYLTEGTKAMLDDHPELLKEFKVRDAK